MGRSLKLIMESWRQFTEAEEVDPTDQKLYDMFLGQGMMAIEIAEQSGMGSPELLKNMKAVVEQVRAMKDNVDGGDVPPDAHGNKDLERRRKLVPGAGVYSARDDRAPSAGRAALRKMGEMFGVDAESAQNELGELGGVIWSAEREYLFPGISRYQGAIQAAVEWAGIG